MIGLQSDPFSSRYFMCATFVVDYEGQRTEGNGVFYWLDDRPNAKLEGFFDLASFCNAKYLFSNKEGFMGNQDEEHRYLRLQKSIPYTHSYMDPYSDPPLIDTGGSNGALTLTPMSLRSYGSVPPRRIKAR